MLYDFCTALSAIIFKIFFGFRIKGREVFPKTGPFILASNHASNLDPIAVSAACPRRVYFIAKEELFHNKIGFFPVSPARPADQKRNGRFRFDTPCFADPFP